MCELGAATGRAHSAGRHCSSSVARTAGSALVAVACEADDVGAAVGSLVVGERNKVDCVAEGGEDVAFLGEGGEVVREAGFLLT